MYKHTHFHMCIAQTHTYAHTSIQTHIHTFLDHQISLVFDDHYNTDTRTSYQISLAYDNFITPFFCSL